MKKFLSIISLVLVFVMLTSVLSSCNNNRKKFVGTWQEIDEDGEFVSDGEVLVFANDGTGSVTSDGISGSMSWSVDGDKLFMTLSMCGISQSQEFHYKFSGKTMILTDLDGETSIYRKK